MVEFLGLAGNAARGVVFGGAGVFLVVAAASSGPDQAQVLDGSLCKIATTPLGPDSALARAPGWPHHAARDTGGSGGVHDAGLHCVNVRSKMVDKVLARGGRSDAVPCRVRAAGCPGGSAGRWG